MGVAAVAQSAPLHFFLQVQVPSGPQVPLPLQFPPPGHTTEGGVAQSTPL
jgi:hypothetical protein